MALTQTAYVQTDRHVGVLLNFLKINLVYKSSSFFNCSELTTGMPEVEGGDDELMLNVLNLTY